MKYTVWTAAFITVLFGTICLLDTCGISVVHETSPNTLTDVMKIRGASYDSIQDAIDSLDYTKIRRGCQRVLQAGAIPQHEYPRIRNIIGSSQIQRFRQLDAQVLREADSLYLSASQGDLYRVQHHFDILDKQACGGCHQRYWETIHYYQPPKSTP